MKLNDTLFERRGFLKGVGVASLGIGALPARVAAKGGKLPLQDIGVDLTLYFSTEGAGERKAVEPDAPDHFGYPYTPMTDPSKGMFFWAHDPAPPVPPASDPTFFRISDIEMTPGGGSLHHTLQFFAGHLISGDSKPKPYTLVRTDLGRYESRGQVMNFEAVKSGDLPGFLTRNGKPVPPFHLLTDPDKNLSWRAVGADRVQLATDNGELVTDGEGHPRPEWGLTRIDFYRRGKGPKEFVVSLLYNLWDPSLGSDWPSILPKQPSGSPLPPITSGVPMDGDADPDDVHDVTLQQLIEPGRMNQGGQPKKKK